MDAFEDRFRELPGALPSICKFCLRGLLAFLLGCLIWRYISIVKQGIRSGGKSLADLSMILDLIWKYLTFAGMLYMAYDAWLLFGVGPVQPSSALTPSFKARSIVQEVKGLEIRLAEMESEEGLEPVVFGENKMKLYLHREPLIQPGDIRESRVVKSSLGDPLVTFEIADSALENVRKTTAAHRGIPVAVLMDGKVVTAPIILDPIDHHGSFGGMPFEIALRIAKGFVGIDK